MDVLNDPRLFVVGPRPCLDTSRNTYVSCLGISRESTRPPILRVSKSRWRSLCLDLPFSTCFALALALANCSAVSTGVRAKLLFKVLRNLLKPPDRCGYSFPK